MLILDADNVSVIYLLHTITLGSVILKPMGTTEAKRSVDQNDSCLILENVRNNTETLIEIGIVAPLYGSHNGN